MESLKRTCSLIATLIITTASLVACDESEDYYRGKEMFPAPLHCKMTSVEDAKRLVGVKAIDQYVKDGMVLGIGSGSTIVYAVERLKAKVKEENLKVFCIPTSFQSRQLIVEAGLPLVDLISHPEIDVAFDGADEADENLNLIKGGGGCQMQEKVVAYNAKKFIVIADYRKESKRLGENWHKGVPVEVLPMAFEPVKKKVEKLFPKAKANLRMASDKAGPTVTDNGNFILDVDFGAIEDPAALNQKLISIPGVLETGLFVGMAHHAFFGQKDGSVTEKFPPK